MINRIFYNRFDKHFYLRLVFLCYIAQNKKRVMEQVVEKIDKEIKESPSWLDILIGEKLKMTVEEQVAYKKLHWKEIQARVKALDERLAKYDVLIADEDEIADLVSKDRRAHYEKSIGN